MLYKKKNDNNKCDTIRYNTTTIPTILIQIIMYCIFTFMTKCKQFAILFVYLTNRKKNWFDYYKMLNLHEQPIHSVIIFY